MYNYERTDLTSMDFIKLVNLLDVELHKKNGDIQDKYDSFNSIKGIKNVIVAYDENKAIGCGCFKEFDEKSCEIKRVYVKPEYRKKNIATEIVGTLEEWAIELGYNRAVLETGAANVEAIKLYENCNFHKIPNFAPYENMITSVCYEKILNDL